VDEARALHRQGLSISDFAGITGFDCKTLRKWLTQLGPPRAGARALRPNKLDPLQAHIEQRLSAAVWNAQVLLRQSQSAGCNRPRG